MLVLDEHLAITWKMSLVLTVAMVLFANSEKQARYRGVRGHLRCNPESSSAPSARQ